MVRDVRYITLSSSYRDLQEALVTGQLKTLALVESKGEIVRKENICTVCCRERGGWQMSLIQLSHINYYLTCLLP